MNHRKSLQPSWFIAVVNIFFRVFFPLQVFPRICSDISRLVRGSEKVVLAPQPPVPCPHQHLLAGPICNTLGHAEKEREKQSNREMVPQSEILDLSEAISLSLW